VLSLRSLACLAALGTTLAACAPIKAKPVQILSSSISEVKSRDLVFGEYPQSGRTYLSFDLAHGFQVAFIKNGKSWLWYAGNQRPVTSEFKFDTVAGQIALCWRHQANSGNPVTGQSGGKFACEALAFSRKRVVAQLLGDSFNLSTGTLPFVHDRCSAPEAFQFDRNRFRC
jgi:hypothetical protein